VQWSLLDPRVLVLQHITYCANEHSCSYNGCLVGRYTTLFLFYFYSTLYCGSSCYIYYILFHPATIVVNSVRLLQRVRVFKMVMIYRKAKSRHDSQSKFLLDMLLLVLNMQCRYYNTCIHAIWVDLNVYYTLGDNGLSIDIIDIRRNMK